VLSQVFCNPIGLGIDTAKTEPSSQTLELDAGQLAAGCKLDLRFVLFQKVSSLALFFPGNHDGVAARRAPGSLYFGLIDMFHVPPGGERTVIERLAVHGMIVPQARRAHFECFSASARGTLAVAKVTARSATGRSSVGQRQRCPRGHGKGGLARQEEPGLSSQPDGHLHARGVSIMFNV
jgi:hypothetical protein